MAILMQSDWLQRLHYFWTQRSGWARICAGLLCVAIGLSLLLLPPLQALRAPSGAVDTASRRSVTAPAAAMPAIEPLTATATRLADWPPIQQADNISAEILGLADRTGLLFERAEFNLQRIEGSPSLAIQSIKLPVKGSYIQIRQFINTVLQRYPSLALTDCQLQRQDISQSEVMALLHLNLYVREEPR